MRYILYLGIIGWLCGGCVKYVDVPVWVCPEPNVPKKQPLKTRYVTKESSDQEKIRALVWDITYLDGYSRQLEMILKGYEKKEVGTKPP